VEARHGRPAKVKSTGSEQDPGLLRIDFPGYRGSQSLEGISWDEFFQKFDEKQLAFLYQETMKSGKESRFFKLISQSTAQKLQQEMKEREEKKEPALTK
jgi:hypothetical protein